MLVFFAYQKMFAIITPALITGAFSNRLRFPAYLVFLVAWLLLVYFPFVHMIWGGGLLAQWGVLDFAGGIAVHNIAGMAALASVLFIGARRVAEKGPHSIPLVAIVVSSIYAFAFTYGMLWVINKIIRVKTTEVEESTLDESLHGEHAYEDAV